MAEKKKQTRRRRKPLPGVKLNENELVRLWADVDRSGGDNSCWPWTGLVSIVDGRRYSRFHVDNGRGLSAARLVYSVTSGTAIPDNVHLRRHCGNSLCVNPAHSVNYRVGLLATGETVVDPSVTCVHGHLWAQWGVTYADGRLRCRLCAYRHHAEHMARKQNGTTLSPRADWTERAVAYLTEKTSPR